MVTYIDDFEMFTLVFALTVGEALETLEEYLNDLFTAPAVPLFD